MPLTNMRYISGWVESIVLRRKVRDFYKFFKICQIRILKEIRRGTDRIITALRIQVLGYTVDQ